MEALTETLRQAGIGGATFRSVGAASGTPSSNLQYRFGSKDRLLLAGVRAIAQEERARTATLAEELGACTLDRPAVARILAAMTFGRRERSAANSRVLLESLFGWSGSSELVQEARSWAEGLDRFWRRVALAAGTDEVEAAFLADLHFGLMLHFSGSRDRVEAALVGGEIIDGAFGEPAAAHPFFARFLQASLSAIPAEVDRTRPVSGPSRELLARATALLQEQGPQALTYRALAERAGQSASAVAHHFSSREVLVYAAYRFMHRQLIEHARVEAAHLTTVEPAMALAIATHPRDGRHSWLATYSAFGLYSEHHPEFDNLARFLRMTRGLYHLRKDDPAFDPFGAEAFAAFAHSFALVGTVMRRMAAGSARPPGSLEIDAVALALKRFGVAGR